MKKKKNKMKERKRVRKRHSLNIYRWVAEQTII